LKENRSAKERAFLSLMKISFEALEDAVPLNLLKELKSKLKVEDKFKNILYNVFQDNVSWVSYLPNDPVIAKLLSN